jgi:acetyltransferase
MLESMMTPRSVAVIGASKSPSKVGYGIVDNLIKGGFKGPIVPVNPTTDNILGLPCVPDLTAYKGTLDLAVIVVPRTAVLAAAGSAIDKGATAIIVISAGYKETGKEGAQYERELAEYCRGRGARLMGPNCLGLINTYHTLNASFAAKMPPRGGISVMSQSGALCTAILDWAASRRVGLAKLVSIGNKADLNEIDFLAALGEDPETKVIAGYLESIASGDEFVRVAEAVAQKKPVVIFKSGKTQSGGRAASSHTGSLAGTDIAYSAAFKRAGVLRADTFESLFDAAVALAAQPLPRGNRVAVITNAGGPGIMATDAVEISGRLRMADLTPAVQDEIRPKLPAAASVGNPIDVLGDADADRYGLAIRAAVKDDAVDAVIVVLTPQSMSRPVETAHAVAEASRNCGKPILASFMGGADVCAGREALLDLSIPDYTSPERAAGALAAMEEYATWRRRPARVVTPIAADRAAADSIISKQMTNGGRQIGEVKAKAILRAYGFSVPDGGLATSAAQAAEIAARVGCPVAMKVVSPDIIHKSDVGGVRLNLAAPDQVRDAYTQMMAGIAQRVPEARIDGAYVEKMAGRGREVILGMTRDPQFGPMLMFGLGGVFVEVMKDVSFQLAPLTAEEAHEMLARTKSYALLKGFRGQAGVDIPAIVNGLQRVSQLVLDFPQIQELDVNPFIVGEAGAPSFAADARITLDRGAAH